MRRYRTRIKGKKEEKSNIVRLFTVLAALTSQPYGGVLLSRFIQIGYFTFSRHHDVRRTCQQQFVILGFLPRVSFPEYDELNFCCSGGF